MAEFSYDPLGRRSTRTVNGLTTRYLYDGPQAVAELTDGRPPVTLLTGLGIDEAIARYSEAGARTYLTDALGSVLALAGEDQVPTAFYAYSPFGETAASGETDDNASQYTGREHDGTGLYYYRARYYDPVLKRFISEDPIGLAGGDNVYGYVGGNPVSAADPFGLEFFPFLRPLIEPLTKPLKTPEPPPGTPKPPGWTPEWEWGYPEGKPNENIKPRWFDPKGGEWRRHYQDKWHNDEHWDHNPWEKWNDKWRNLDDDGNPLPGKLLPFDLDC